MIKIAPSILSADFSILKDEIKRVESANADYLHIDVMDGHFVPNITLGPDIVKALRKHTKLFFDVHLMIEKVDPFIPLFCEAGADAITIHVEKECHLHRSISLVKSFGKKVGVAINPATSLSTVLNVLEDIDMILIMTVNPGFGGQKFIESTIKKIEEARKIITNNNLNIDISVDGGITTENIEKVTKAGANIIVSGSTLFKSENMGKTIELMRELEYKG